jgi:hypothetical protein
LLLKLSVWKDISKSIRHTDPGKTDFCNFKGTITEGSKGVYMINNILVFRKIIIVRERGLHFKVLFARYNKSDHGNNLFGKRFRTGEVLGKLANFPGGEL